MDKKISIGIIWVATTALIWYAMDIASSAWPLIAILLPTFASMAILNADLVYRNKDIEE